MAVLLEVGNGEDNDNNDSNNDAGKDDDGGGSSIGVDGALGYRSG